MVTLSVVAMGTPTCPAVNSPSFPSGSARPTLWVGQSLFYMGWDARGYPLKCHICCWQYGMGGVFF